MNRYFFVFLFILVLISFGQILWMQPWQDDNALIFKLAHIEEAAGFLGKGVFGEGPYRYIATPYYLIYSIFGLNIAAFFGLALMFYFISTVSIYFLLKVLIDKNTGRLASILYATNYVTSDSFIRLFNSVSSSLGVIFLSSLIISYWKFLQTKKFIFFSLAILAFWLASEFTYVRSHYLIAVVILIEIIIGRSSLRLIPFVLIFVWQYIINGDVRSAESINNINLILSGKFENLFSIFTGFSQLVLPDKLVKFMPMIVSNIVANQYYQILALNILFFVFVNLLVIKFSKQSIYVKLIFFTAGLSWFLISRLMYLKLPPATPYITLLIGYLGGLSILALALLGSALKNSKLKIYFLFLMLIISNISFYILYDPTLFYGVYNSRYLVHSYVGLIGILAIIGTQFKHRIFLILILVWGVVNLFFNILNQHEIRSQRSLPIYNFHKQLKEAIIDLPKNSILYFDLQDDIAIKTRFSDAITSSQMPETTAIAWRFGLDRDDFSLTTDYEDLIKAIDDKQITQNKIYSFWYSKDGLFDTTKQIRASLVNEPKKEVVIESEKAVNVINREDIVLDLEETILSVTPIDLQFTIQAKVADPRIPEFPFYRQGVDQAVVIFPIDQRNLGLKYGVYKDLISKNATYTVSDSWKKRISKNLYDQNYQTIWQADRVLWQKNIPFILIDIKELIDINRLVWINGFADNTPIEYNIEGSRDGKAWFKIKNIKDSKRLDDGEFQIIEFEPQNVRFLKITFLKTLNNDSPAIAEIWPVPLDYAKLDLYRVEYLLKDPFGFIPDSANFEEELRTLNYQGTIQVYWLSDKSDKWLTDTNAKIKIIYDGISHNYNLKIPAGGTQLKKIKFGNIQIPGIISLRKVGTKNESKP